MHCQSKLTSLVFTDALHPKSSSATSSVFICSQPNVCYPKSRFFRVNNYCFDLNKFVAKDPSNFIKKIIFNVYIFNGDPYRLDSVH